MRGRRSNGGSCKEEANIPQHASTPREILWTSVGQMPSNGAIEPWSAWSPGQPLARQMVRQYVPFVAPSQADNDEDDTKPTTMKQSSGDFDLPATSSMAARCTTPNPLNSWILGSLGIPHQVGPRMRHGAQCVLRLVCEEHWTSGLAVGCGSQVLHGFLNYSSHFWQKNSWGTMGFIICIYNYIYTYIFI